MFCVCFSIRRRHTWCALVTEFQTCALPICAFEHVYFRHPLYNPGGTVPSAVGCAGRIDALRDWRPSFVAAVSVFTHLEADTVRASLADIRAILAHGGRLFLTAFLTGPGTPAPTEASAFPQAIWSERPPPTALLGEPLTAEIGSATCRESGCQYV